MRRFLAIVLVAAGLVGCGSTPSVPESPLAQDLMRTQVKAALAEFRQTHPAAEAILQSAYAYAVFPQVTSGALVLGGAHGEGEVFVRKGGSEEFAGYADVSQGSVGAQIGGQSYTELVFFKSELPYADFVGGDLSFDARASAVAAANGSATAADYQRGVLVITWPRSGLMAQAAIGAQKFRFAGTAK